MPKRKPDVLKWVGLIVTLIGFISTAGVAYYRIGRLEETIGRLWQLKADKDFVADKLTDFKLEQQDHEARLRVIERKR